MTIADLQSAFAALHFLRPLWLWALLALPLIVIGWQLRRRARSAWRDAVDAHLLPHLLEAHSLTRDSVAPWLLTLAFALAILALAGPSWQRGAQPLLQTQSPLVIALDLSSAALANDLPPSRLLQARAKLATLLRQRAGGQVGLVAFADDAYTVAPLTDDTANVALFLDSLTPDVMPVDGSNAARAIAQATALMVQAGFDGGDILVLGDHADADARAAAAEAGRKGFRVSALGLGSEAGAAYRMDDGRIAQTRLDASSLRALASAGGGRYAALSADKSDLDSLGVLRADVARDAAQSRGDSATVWRDGGFWLLPPLMLLMLLAFRRGGAFAAVLLCVCLPWPPAHAQTADAGGDAQGTVWRRADQAQHAQLQQGVDAYRKRDFADAAQRWTALPGADAAYNRGNALAQAGKYEDAIAAYDAALRAQPAMADAIANRKAVEAALKRQPPPSKQPDSRGKQQQGNSGKPGDGQSNPQPGRVPGQQPGQSPGAGNPPPSQARKPGDASPQDAPPGEKNAAPPDDTPRSDAARAQAQREADAAQRDRMQQALNRNAQGKTSGNGEPVDAQAPRNETAAQRERRQANAAWLKRVPDDPGGLLRAKFRLEYERRQQTGER